MPQQLDIFEDSRDVWLRNDLAQAIVDGDAARARLAAEALAQDFAEDRVLAPAALLIDHLCWQQLQPAGAALAVADVLALRQRLEGGMAPAALAALGTRGAAPWLARQWRWLAERAEGIGWRADQADAHAAALSLRAGAWAQAARAVERIPSWRRVPVPLLWMAHARWRGDGADAAWPLLAEAFWMAPARTAALLRQLADRSTAALMARFEERFEDHLQELEREHAPSGTGDHRQEQGRADSAPHAGTAWAWLPAFAIVDNPLLANTLATAEPPADSIPAQGYALVAALLRLERQGRHHDIVAHRARLKTVSAPLFKAYMNTR